LFARFLITDAALY